MTPFQLHPAFSKFMKWFDIYIQHKLSAVFIAICGDVECNPGPYNFLKCIQESFSQTHEKFGDTRGTQCSCITLYGICFAVFKPVSRWNKNDLECVIEKNSPSSFRASYSCIFG